MLNDKNTLYPAIIQDKKFVTGSSNLLLQNSAQLLKITVFSLQELISLPIGICQILNS